MNINTFLAQLQTNPESVEFEDAIAAIDANYDFTQTEFTNGDVLNQAGQNNGSCKILAFALLHQLSIEQTLNCFGRFYRIDVLQNPDGDDHQNIRTFMTEGNGLTTLIFKGDALSPKN